MPKNLVIVESPAKAKTIEGYLGKDYIVRSSYGHVRDLAQKDLSVDVENNFAPVYVVSQDKKKLIKELKSLADKAECVWLATDEDREGEAISWHLLETLGLESSKTRRITFNEITKQAIQRAIDSPREINEHLVNAQQARRVLDRLVGYELSPVLWKKIKPSLSAGRVQSVSVRLIVEREREILDFKPKSSFRVVAELQAGGKKFRAELNKRFDTAAEAEGFLNGLNKDNVEVISLEKKPGKRSPAAPFTTSTLQQEASRKLGYAVGQTMSVAQRLYEAGKISYMRTDSVNLSDTAIQQAGQEITKEFGQEYTNPRRFVNKAKGAQEAHEAIRPTNMAVRKAGGSSQEERLYDLIWKRTLASQMADAQIEKTTIRISTGTEFEFIAKGEILTFEGFLKVYLEGTDDEDQEEMQGRLPNVSAGDKVGMDRVEATQRFTHHPPRYTEASLVKKLEELGIGRPSTYAPTISTIIKRQYVVKEDRPGVKRDFQVFEWKDGSVESRTETENTGAEKKKLFPTDIGMVVNDFLVDNFERILDYNFTAQVEKQFDDIAEGMQEWTAMLEEFYGPFKSNIEDTKENSERARGERVLGVDPESGKNVYAKLARYGPVVQIGEADDEEKPKFASLRKNQSISSITFEEAMDLFKLPRELGELDGEMITAAIGRYGPYVKIGKEFVSLRPDEGDDPMTVTLDRAIELIKEKRELKKNALIKSFEENEDVQVLNGRYGPYIKIGKKNYKIPKDRTPEDLTLEECLEIAENAPKRKGRKK